MEERLDACKIIARTNSPPFHDKPTIGEKLYRLAIATVEDCATVDGSRHHASASRIRAEM